VLLIAECGLQIEDWKKEKQGTMLKELAQWAADLDTDVLEVRVFRSSGIEITARHLHWNAEMEEMRKRYSWTEGKAIVDETLLLEAFKKQWRLEQERREK